MKDILVDKIFSKWEESERMRAQDEFILGQESTVSYCHEIGRAVFPKEKIQYTQVKTQFSPQV